MSASQWHSPPSGHSLIGTHRPQPSLSRGCTHPGLTPRSGRNKSQVGRVWAGHHPFLSEGSARDPGGRDMCSAVLCSHPPPDAAPSISGQKGDICAPSPFPGPLHLAWPGPPPTSALSSPHGPYLWSPAPNSLQGEPCCCSLVLPKPPRPHSAPRGPCSFSLLHLLPSDHVSSSAPASRACLAHQATNREPLTLCLQLSLPERPSRRLQRVRSHGLPRETVNSLVFSTELKMIKYHSFHHFWMVKS